MEKETILDREPTIKKRRKTSSATTASSSVKVFEGDVYQNVIHFEEAESSLRDPEKDKELFSQTCDVIRNLMQEIADLKSEIVETPKNEEEDIAEINNKRVEASMQFVILKKLNRLEKFRTKSSRDTLNKVKQQVDSYHLQLQNLLYEIEHLKKEVTKCLQFKSKDEEIDLVSVEEFYKDAPPSISKLALTKSNSHQLKLARLEWELEQRKQLAALCHKLQASKETVGKEIQIKRERLDNLAPRLRNILEVTKPLQDYLGLPLDQVRKQHQVAYLLPKPLYVLYVQADAYREACDSLMTVSVSGDEEEARMLKHSVDDSEAAEESDSDQEEGGEGKRHRRKQSRVDRLEERRKQLLQPHPLTVEVLIKLKDESSVMLSFRYMVHLHVVTVKPQVNLVQSVHGVCATELIAPRNILMSLFPNDFGLDSPNVANHYQLQHLGLEVFSCYIEELGMPYIWAQRVAGLDFMGARAAEIINSTDNQKGYIEPKTSVSQASVESVMRGIRQRLKARLALCKQVMALESGTVMRPPSQCPNIPSKLSSLLTLWQLVTWEDYRLAPSTQSLIRDQVVSQTDIFYKAILTRGTAKLVALIALKCNYPSLPTIFSLQLNWHGEHNAASNDAMRDMERELNVYWMELVEQQGCGWAHTLLTAQIMRLQACLDVFLEAGGAIGISPPEFPRDKIFFKPVRGRNRSRPYKYLQLGGGIFTQR